MNRRPGTLQQPESLAVGVGEEEESGSAHQDHRQLREGDCGVVHDIVEFFAPRRDSLISAHDYLTCCPRTAKERYIYTIHPFYIKVKHFEQKALF